MSDAIRSTNDAKPLVGSFAELENLLDLADSYDAKCGELRGTLSHGYCAGFIVCCLILFVNVWLNVEETVSLPVRYLAGALGFACAIWGVLFWIPSFKRMKRKLATNVRTLNALVDLLRATETILSQRSILSFLEHSSLRIRIARFDIGPEADPLHASADSKPFVPLVSSPVSFRELREAEQPTHS